MIPRVLHPWTTTPGRLHGLQVVPFLGLVFLILLFPAYGAILDTVPSACTSACEPVASSLESCQYLTCICDDQHGGYFESCLTCLYQLSPTNETYTAAQDTLQSVQTNCRDSVKVVLNLNITYIPPSSTPSTSISISTSTSGASSNPTSESQMPTPTVSSNSTTITSSSAVTSSSTSINYGSGSDKQICRLQSSLNSPPRLGGGVAVSYPSPGATGNTGPVNIRAVLAFLAALIFIPIAVLVVRT